MRNIVIIVLLVILVILLVTSIVLAVKAKKEGFTIDNSWIFPWYYYKTLYSFDGVKDYQNPQRKNMIPSQQAPTFEERERMRADARDKEKVERLIPRIREGYDEADGEKIGKCIERAESQRAIDVLGQIAKSPFSISVPEQNVGWGVLPKVTQRWNTDLPFGKPTIADDELCFRFNKFQRANGNTSPMCWGPPSS